jgi:hypothetical protein
METARSKFTTLKQICELIPPHLIPKLAREHKVAGKCRAFSATSHVASLVFAQLSHALSLNDVCDTLRNHPGPLATIRGCTPPPRNTLSHANRTREPAMAEELFWATLAHLRMQSPLFAAGKRYVALPRRFKRAVHAMDSSTIELVANCMDWARHRRRKAAAKMHTLLNLNSFLPSFVIVDAARHSDPSKAEELCAGLQAGEVVVFDKAYNDFGHLARLTGRGVFWVGRAKENMAYEIVRDLPPGKEPDILRDAEIRLTCAKTVEAHPGTLRLIRAMVELEGKAERVEMVFITNNFEWAASSVCGLYKARWGVETFFKQIKQTLQLADFMGNNANAVRWQIWTALLTYILLRHIAHAGKWAHSFSRLFTLLRGVLWECLDVFSLVLGYGTAPGPPRLAARPDQAYLPGLKP